MSNVVINATQETVELFAGGPTELVINAYVGETGHGIPAGGTDGYILSKESDADYDTVWIAQSAATVTSVNSETGAVVLDYSDVGADPSGTATTLVTNHENDTTAIHGITNTASLETTTGAQTKVDSHINDTSAAHAATAVAFTPAGTIAATTVQAAIEEVATEAAASGAVDSVNGETGAVTIDAGDIGIVDAANDFTATNVETALAELQSDAETDATGLSDHIADTSAAHAASAVSFTAGGTIAGTDAQTAIAEVATDAATALSTHEADTTSIHGITDTSALETTTGSQTKVDTHVNDSSAVHAASAIASTPAGNLGSTNLQDAVNELDSEKQPVDTDLTSIAALTTTTYGRSLLTTADSNSLPGADGWIADADTWVYASATTFTIAGVDRTARFQKGTRVSYNDGSVDYGVVIASSFSTNTTVTLATNADYSIANATLTAPRYSYAVSPVGYPTWFGWTPTLTGWSSNPTNTVNRFNVQGNTCFFHIRQVTVGTSNATTKTATIPIPASTLSANMSWYGAGQVTDNGVGQFGIAQVTTAVTTASIYPGGAAGTAWTASGNCRILGLEMFYEI